MTALWVPPLASCMFVQPYLATESVCGKCVADGRTALSVPKTRGAGRQISPYAGGRGRLFESHIRISIDVFLCGVCLMAAEILSLCALVLVGEN